MTVSPVSKPSFDSQHTLSPHLSSLTSSHTLTWKGPSDYSPSNAGIATISSVTWDCMMNGIKRTQRLLHCGLCTSKVKIVLRNGDMLVTDTRTDMDSLTAGFLEKRSIANAGRQLDGKPASIEPPTISTHESHARTP